MPETPPILVCDNVTKAFGGVKSFRAVDRLSFTVARGAIFGFIGPNGAGKTTTLRMIATLLEPDEGEITVAGFNAIDYPREVRALIGYMPDDVGMYDGVRVWEYLDFFGAAYRIRGDKLATTVANIMQLTDLVEVKDKLISTLSKGMRQRLILAKTLLHDPQLLVLDEPAAGLDPRARIELRLLLKELQRMGKTIIISSHILTELSDICDHVGIIEQGRMVASGSVDAILARRTDALRIKLRLLDAGERAVNVLKGIDRVSDVTADGLAVSFSYAGREADLPALLRGLLDAGLLIAGFEQENRNLEDIFLAVTRGAVA
jgi:ABC-2 type transport system ATP-binding protein